MANVISTVEQVTPEWLTEVLHRENALPRGLENLLAHESDWFPPHLQLLYETILQQMMHLWRTYMVPRLADFSNLTLTHGDAYLANFLCPREGQMGSTYLIDWQSLLVAEDAVPGRCL